MTFYCWVFSLSLSHIHTRARVHTYTHNHHQQHAPTLSTENVKMTYLKPSLRRLFLPLSRARRLKEDNLKSYGSLVRISHLTLPVTDGTVDHQWSAVLPDLPASCITATSWRRGMRVWPLRNAAPWWEATFFLLTETVSCPLVSATSPPKHSFSIHRHSVLRTRTE